MEENNNGAASTAEAKSPQPNWSALSSNTETVEIVAEPKVETTAATETPALEVKPDAPTVEPEKKSTEEPAKTETPTETPSEEADEFKLDVSLIKDAPKIYAEDSFQKLAYDTLGIDLPEDSFEAFKKTLVENYVPKTKLEEVAAISKEKFFSTLKPETAAALELRELGVPDEYILNPTQDIDAYLKLEDAELVRATLANQEGWTEEMVDAEMEDLASNNPSRMTHLAQKSRVNLTNARNQILNERANLVQQYTNQAQQAEKLQKQESDNKFFEQLAKEQKFLELPISKEAKDLIVEKYKRGAYDKVLDEPKNRMLAILHHEFGDETAKRLVTRSKAQAKAEEIKKLADVPPRTQLGGGSVQIPAEKGNNWGALKSSS